MRTVIYARYSSNWQNSASIDQQFADCRARADREGWTIVDTFYDAAISGAAGIDQISRPGVAAMLKRLERGDIQQVLVDTTSRLARGQADSHRLRDDINDHGARLYSLGDGVIDRFKGAIKGLMDEQFRVELGHNVRRGHRDLIRAGRSTGAVTYGYRRVSRFDDKGEAVRGLREVDPDTSEIVRRIFAEYVAGQSPNQIAVRLNAEGVPSPRGSFWATRAITGEPSKGFGILRNPVYIGELVYGRTRTSINPRTRMKRFVVNTDEPPITQIVPELRIIDDDTWAKAQAILAERSIGRPEYQRRPKHLLSGLGICGVCGKGWTKISADFWGCARYRNGRACTNNRLIGTEIYQKRVLAELKGGMLDPAVVTAYVREYHRDYAARIKGQDRERATVERKLAEANRRMDRLIGVVAEGGSEFSEIRDLLATARDERNRLDRELASLQALPTVMALHPRLDEEYRRQVEDLTTALAEPSTQIEAIPRVRELIARIVVMPDLTKKRGVVLEVVRQMDEVLQLANRQSA